MDTLHSNGMDILPNSYLNILHSNLIDFHHSSLVYILLNNLPNTNNQMYTPSSRIGVLHQLTLLLNIHHIHRSLLPTARYIWPNSIQRADFVSPDPQYT